MDEPRDRELGYLHEAAERRALGDDGVVVEDLPRRELGVEQAVLLDLQKPPLRLGGDLLALARVLCPLREQLRRHLGVPLLQPRRELAVEREVGIAADGRGEVGVVALGEAEVADRGRVVDRALHRPQDHHRDRRVERVALDGGEELRHHLLVAEVAGLDADGLELRAQHQQLLRVRRLVEAREDPDPARPELLGDGLVRGDHALLDHLVRLVVGAGGDALELAVAVERDLRLGDLDVERAGGEAARAQLHRERGDGAHGPELLGADAGDGRAAAADDRHHLLVGEARAGADDAFRELAADHLAGAVEGHEHREREPVLAGHERADAVGELLGEHRHHAVAEVDAGAAAVRLAVERGAWLHVVGDVRDVHAEDAVAAAVGLERERVVEVPRRLGVAGEDELLPEVEPALRRNRAAGDPPRLLQRRRRERLGQPVELHHRRGVLARRPPRRRKPRLAYLVKRHVSYILSLQRQ